MDLIRDFADRYLSYLPSLRITDIVEIVIISVIVYGIMVWIRNTKAWALMKGVVFIMLFFLLAVVFKMNTILWIARSIFLYGIIALIITLQPELRKALEELGKREFIPSLLLFDSGKQQQDGLFSDRTINEIARSCMEMGRVKTGALIVVAQNDPLMEYERTGIEVDGIVSSQLLINIFEHNTPLHDGAVIIRGDRITSATCYLPLSDNMTLSKDLGTRHRAAVGMSEATDAMIVIVSEETGMISVAYKGALSRGVTQAELAEQLRIIQHKPAVEEKKEKKERKRRKAKKAEPMPVEADEESKNEEK